MNELRNLARFILSFCLENAPEAVVNAAHYWLSARFITEKFLASASVLKNGSELPLLLPLPCGGAAKK